MKHLFSLLAALAVAFTASAAEPQIPWKNISKNGLYASASDITNSLNVAWWGDSLTAGAGSTNGQIPTVRLAALTGYTVFNGGVGGEGSTQIKARMLAATSRYGHMTIIWAGRNNYSSGTTVKADIAAMVAALGHDRFLVLSILNGSGSDEWLGNAGYISITQLNADLAAIYGARYLDVRAHLVSLYNPGIPQDVTDFGHDVPPSSLRYDGIHLNDAGYLAVAQKVNSVLTTLQGSFSTVVSPANLSNYFRSPPMIGAVTPNEGKFTSVTATGETTINAASVGLNVKDSGFTGVGGLLRYTSSAGVIRWSVGMHNSGSGAEETSLKFTRHTGSAWADTLELGGGIVKLPEALLQFGPARQISISGTGTSFQFDGGVIPTADGAYDLGYSASQQRFRHAYLTGNVYAAAAGISGNVTIVDAVISRPAAGVVGLSALSVAGASTMNGDVVVNAGSFGIQVKDSGFTGVGGLLRYTHPSNGTMWSMGRHNSGSGAMEDSLKFTYNNGTNWADVMTLDRTAGLTVNSGGLSVTNGNLWVNGTVTSFNSGVITADSANPVVQFRTTQIGTRKGADIIGGMSDTGGTLTFRRIASNGTGEQNVVTVDVTPGFTQGLHIHAGQFRVSTANTPASAAATGTVGTVCWDANYIYVCVATDTWKRSALSTW